MAFHSEQGETSSIDRNVDEKANGSYTEHTRFDLQSTKRLLRKCDKALLPFLALLYLLSFLDRANIGNARLAGLEEDLGMSGLDYNVSQQCSPTPWGTIRR